MNFISSSATSSLPRGPPAAGGSSAPLLLVGAPVSAICGLLPPCAKTLGYCKFLAMPLTAVGHVRKMRGGAQAHLVEADDGHWYVVKFRNNPQHRRILVNELVASVFLDYLRIAAPETALVHISGGFLADNPDVHITMGTRQIAVEPGWHFGSRYPGDPGRT